MAKGLNKKKEAKKPRKSIKEKKAAKREKKKKLNWQNDKSNERSCAMVAQNIIHREQTYPFYLVLDSLKAHLLYKVFLR